jgi:hypothetical protein
MKRLFLVPIALLLPAASAHGGPEIRDIQAAYGPLRDQQKALDVFPWANVCFRFLASRLKPDAEDTTHATTTVQVSSPGGKDLLQEHFSCDPPFIEP